MIKLIRLLKNQKNKAGPLALLELFMIPNGLRGKNGLAHWARSFHGLALLNVLNDLGGKSASPQINAEGRRSGSEAACQADGDGNVQQYKPPKRFGDDWSAGRRRCRSSGPIPW